MKQVIVLNTERATDLSLLKLQYAVVNKLSLAGMGKLGACMLTFGKQGDSVLAQRDLLFLKPLHEKSEILLPHVQGFSIYEYDYCMLQIFTGHVLSGDEIRLTLLARD